MTDPSEPRQEGLADDAPEPEANASEQETPVPAEAQPAEPLPTAPEPPAAEPPAAEPPAAEPPAAQSPLEAAVAAVSEADLQAEEVEAKPERAESEPTEAGTAEAASEAASEPTETGEPKKKKRKRKKRKKKAAGEAEGDDKAGSLPFHRFFEGHEGRRHAFAVGEIVAGRVDRVARGVVVVDLFGKATAVVDEHEPHEVQPLPEPPPEPEPTQQAEPTAGAAEVAEAAPQADEAASEGQAAAPESAPESTPEAALASEAAPEVEVVPSELAPPAESAAVVSSPEVEPEVEAAPQQAEALPVEVAEPEPGDDESELTTSPGTEEAPAEPEPPPPEPPPLGSIFRGRVGHVAESGHVAIVNRAIDRDAARARLTAAQEERRRVRGIVYGFNRGGFDVLVEGLRAFCPASGMSLEPIEDPAAFVAQKLEFTLPPSKGGSGFIVSRRGILERELRKHARERLKALQPGHRLVGRVTDVRDFGAFVDLGEGVEGMVHVSELSWHRDVRPADVVKPGDEVVVRVLEVKPGTRKERHGRVSLSIRAVEADPWDEHADLLQPGTPTRGRVVRTTDFGAFIEVAPGIDGLLHISELGKDLKHASQAIKEGEEVDVVIDRVDRKQRRISLSKLSPMEAELVGKGELDLSQRPRSLKPGSHITVLVDRVEHGGVVVKVQGVLGKRGRGFIPNRELQSPEGTVDRKALQPGQPLDVKVIGTDRDGGLRCSIRARLLDDERRAVQEYRKEASKQGLGTFGDLLRAKLSQDSSSDGG